MKQICIGQNKTTKQVSNKKRAKPWIINFKTIYGLYLDDTVNVWYKKVSGVC